MKFLYIKKIVLLILITIILLSIYGCGQKSQKPSGQSTEKPPQSLSGIEKDIDTIINALDKEWKTGETAQTGQSSPPRESKDVQSQGSSGQGAQGQSSQSSSGQSSGGQSSGQQSSGQGSNNQQDPWQEVDKTIKDLHKKWNEYQPEALKAGASSESITNFTNSLNVLTNTIVSRSIINILSDANNLYKFVPDFLSHHKDKSVDIKRLKYFTRDTMYNARIDKWNVSESSIGNAKNLLPNIRASAKEDNKAKYQSLEYSVIDLEKVIKERQKNLVQLKGNIILDNIKEIEKINQNEENSKNK